MYECSNKRKVEYGHLKIFPSSLDVNVLMYVRCINATNIGNNIIHELDLFECLH